MHEWSRRMIDSTSSSTFVLLNDRHTKINTTTDHEPSFQHGGQLQHLCATASHHDLEYELLPFLLSADTYPSPVSLPLSWINITPIASHTSLIHYHHVMMTLCNIASAPTLIAQCLSLLTKIVHADHFPTHTDGQSPLRSS